MEATMEEWKCLYEVGLRIKELRPWDHFWDSDIITIVFSDAEPTYYCSIMGRGGLCFGIGTYVGEDGLNGFLSILENTSMPNVQVMRNQRGLFSYFGNRCELTKVEYDVIKSLGYKFRGKHQWLYFHSFKPPYAPYILDGQEVATLTRVYVQLCEAIVDYINGKEKVELDEKETLLRICENNSWSTRTAPLVIPDERHVGSVLTDELLLKRLDNRPRIEAELEMDVAWMGSTIVDPSFERPICLRVAMIAERENGLVVDQHVPTPDQGDAECMLRQLVAFILKYGKPKTIYVRDAFSANILADSCEHLEIGLVIWPQLDIIDNVVEVFRARGA